MSSLSAHRFSLDVIVTERVNGACVCMHPAME